MLKNLNSVTNVAASSMIDDVVVTTMRATIDGDVWNISKNIRDSELYLANQDQCDADYAEFEAEVLRIAKA